MNIIKRKDWGFLCLGMFLLLLGAVVVLPSSEVRANPDVIYVDDSATGLNDGTSWSNAFNYLQDGLAAAGAGDEIWVAMGTYRPDQGGGNSAGDREATFRIVGGVAIYGGFGGSETSLDQRDWDANQTILSGDLAGDDGPGFVNNGENSYQVVTSSEVGATAVVDGFTITAGNADGEFPYGRGGGMYNVYGTPTLANCTFSGNGARADGGGIYNYEGSPTVTDCNFIGNRARAGGGMANAYGSLAGANCTFSNNEADFGGGVYNYESSPVLTDCSFSGNQANRGGGMYNFGESNPSLNGCTFSENQAVGQSGLGGGIYNHTGTAPALEGCTFDGNSALGQRGLGGGVYDYQSSPSITNCTFSGNDAWAGGGITNYESDPTLTDCTFSGNQGDYAGGMYNHGSGPTVNNCTFSGNSVTIAGGAMYNEIGAPSLANCTFSGNQADSQGGGMYNHMESSPTMSDCTFSGNSANSGGGMYSLTSAPSLKACTFSNNEASSNGGGAYNRESELSLTGCTFDDNEGDIGGGMFNDDSNGTLSGCMFSTNSGGGISNSGSNVTLTDCMFSTNSGGGMRNVESSVILTGCIFSGNQSQGGGGGMHNVESSAILNDCAFMGNQAPSGRGGAVYSTLMVDVTATNCIFSGNVAVYGGALAQEYRCTANLTNCTFAANEAWAEGGAVHTDLEGTELSATNCVLWGNADIGGSDESAQIDVGRGAADPVVNYCCIQGWSWEMGGTGNIGEDPLLADPDGQDDATGTEDDDLRLSDNSPCIDAGDNGAVPSDVTTDLDGNERILDGDMDGTATVDMGAYEMVLPEPEQPGAPAAVDDSYSIDLNQESTLDVAAPGVLENDSDADGSQLGALLVSDVSNGTLTLNDDGSFRYTPTGNFRGTDSFTYRVSDGTAESNNASVTITVTGDGDVPGDDDATGGDEDVTGGDDAAPSPAATDDGDATSSSETGGLPFWIWIPVGLGVAAATGILVHLIRIWVLAR